MTCGSFQVARRLFRGGLRLHFRSPILLTAPAQDSGTSRPVRAHLPSAEKRGEKALKGLQTSMSGKAAGTGRIRLRGDHPLNRYHRAYLPIAVQVTSAASVDRWCG